MNAGRLLAAAAVTVAALAGMAALSYVPYAHEAGAGGELRLAWRARSARVEACRRRTAEELGRLFAGLGFRRAGRHLTKEVEWWRQGAINLVINHERESFAQAFWHMHGPGVCALGLSVPDAEAAMARARALLAEPFHQPVPAGQLSVPAIRGVGGSLLYFTDPKSELARVKAAARAIIPEIVEVSEAEEEPAPKKKRKGAEEDEEEVLGENIAEDIFEDEDEERFGDKAEGEYE